MLEKLKAKKEALLKEAAPHEAAIAKIKAKVAIVDEMIADEGGFEAKTIADVAKSVAEVPTETTTNKVVTIRI